MADSVRLKILKNLKTTLEGVTTGAGFNNTLSNVQLFSMLGNSKVSLPCVVISSDMEVREESTMQLIHTDFTAYVTLYHAQEEASAVGSDEFLDTLYQDIVKAIMADETRGGFAVNTNISEIQPFELEEDQHLYGMSFKLEIKFRTEPDDVTAAR